MKEGAGGLRDYHNAYWATRAAHPTTRGIDDLLHFGLLTESEMEQYRSAIDFLWRLRNELHLISKRKNDQMSFEHQEQVATSLGLRRRTGRGAAGGAVHARLLPPRPRRPEPLGARDRAVPRPGGASPPCGRRRREVEDGFRVVRDHLEIPHAAHLRERPARLITAFRVAQDEGRACRGRRGA